MTTAAGADEEERTPFLAQKTAGRGAVAGLAAVVVFSVVHQVMISPIWWMLPIMAVAGALCGAALAWCYTVMVSGPSLGSWAGFVALFLGALVVLGLVSLLVYEPVTTMDRVLTGEVPIAQALPLTIAFTVGFSALLAAVYRKGLQEFGIALASTAVFMILLGLNVSTMGLVSISSTDWVLVLEFLGLVLSLGVVYGAAFCLPLLRLSSRNNETMPSAVTGAESRS